MLKPNLRPLLDASFLNFLETRLVTVRKSLHRSCWTELTCQGILLPLAYGRPAVKKQGDGTVFPLQACLLAAVPEVSVERVVKRRLRLT